MDYNTGTGQNSPSAIQQQYPLSPRKFWKKLLPHLISGTIAVVFLLISTVSVLLSPFTDKDAQHGLIGILLGFIFLLLIVLIISVTLRALYIRAYIRSYYYDTADNFVTIRKGVFTPSEIHVQYSKIQDVYVDQDILDRIMGLYDVHIASATFSSGIAAHIDGLDKVGAEGLKQLLLTKIQHSGNNQTPTPTPTASAPDNFVASGVAESINSETYPISTKWIVSKIIWGFIHSLWTIAIVYSYFYFKDELGGSIVMFIVSVILLGLGFAVLYGIYLFLWRNNFHFNFEDHYITLRQGIISKAEQHIPYKNIQDVRLSQSLLDRVLGTCSINIENAVMSGMGFGSGAAGISASNGIGLPGMQLSQGQHLVELIKAVLGKQQQNNSGL